MPDRREPEGDLGAEASRGEGASRNASEPDSASLHQVRLASPPKKMKPATGRRSNGYGHLSGTSGVIGDGACGSISQEPGRPNGMSSAHHGIQRRTGIHNGSAVPLGVGGVHSSEEAANHRGANPGAPGLLKTCFRKRGGEPIGR